MDELEARIAELAEEEELRAIRPDLDGRQVMAHLGIAPGPVVGEALAFLLELRLDEGPLGGAGQASPRRWWAERRPARSSPWFSSPLGLPPSAEPRFGRVPDVAALPCRQRRSRGAERRRQVLHAELAGPHAPGRRARGRSGATGAGSSEDVDLEVGPLQRREVGRSRCGAGGSQYGLRSTTSPPSSIAAIGVGHREHERWPGPQDAVDLAEDAGQVVHLAEGARGEHEVDRRARGEAEVGQIGSGGTRRAPRTASAARRRARRPRSADGSTAMTRAPALARATALVPLPSSTTRLPATSPHSRSSDLGRHVVAVGDRLVAGHGASVVRAEPAAVDSRSPPRRTGAPCRRAPSSVASLAR